MEIGKTIRELRKSKGYSQEELAKKCGLNRNSIYNYETGKRDINIDTLTKIADALDVNLTTLMIDEYLFMKSEISKKQQILKELRSAREQLSSPQPTVSNNETLKKIVDETLQDIKKLELDLSPPKSSIETTQEYDDLQDFIDFLNKNGITSIESLSSHSIKLIKQNTLSHIDSLIKTINSIY